MSLFRDLGRRAEKLKAQATDAAEGQAPYECGDCGKAIFAERETCPDCESEAVLERETDAPAAESRDEDTTNAPESADQDTTDTTDDA